LTVSARDRGFVPKRAKVQSEISWDFGNLFRNAGAVKQISSLELRNSCWL